MNNQQNSNQNMNQNMNMASNGQNYNQQYMQQNMDMNQYNMQQQMQHMQQMEENGGRENEKQIYTYNSDCIIYALGFSWRESNEFRLAIGSLKEEIENEIRIIKLNENSDADFVTSTTFTHQFPATKLLWIPSKNTANPDILATTSDYLRIWEIDGSGSNRVNMKCELKDASQQFCAPLTSFDWNQMDPSIIGV